MRRKLIGFLVAGLLGAQPPPEAEADSLFWWGNYPEAYRRYEALLSSTSNPENLMWALSGMAFCRIEEQRWEEADSLLQKAAKFLLQSGPVGKLRFLLVQATLHRRQGNYEEVERLLTMATDSFKTLETLDYMLVLRLLGALRADQTRLEEAEKLLHRALQIGNRLLFPTHPAVALTILNLADLCEKKGAYSEADSFSTLAREKFRASLGPNSIDYALATMAHGNLHLEWGNIDIAESLLTEAYTLLRRAETPTLYTAIAAQNLANLYHEKGLVEKAEALYRQTILIFSQTIGPSHLYLAYPIGNLGSLQYDQGRYEEAYRSYSQALEIYKATFGPTHPEVASMLMNLANVYDEMQNPVLAESLYIEAYNMKKGSLGENHPECVRVLSNLANLHADHHRYFSAESLYTLVLRAYDQTLGKLHLRYLLTLCNLAHMYLHKKETHIADSLLEGVAYAYRKNQMDTLHGQVLFWLSLKAKAAWQSGATREADSLYKILSLRCFEVVRRLFPVLSAHQRRLLLQNTLMRYLYELQRYVAEGRATDPEMTIWAYRVARSMKGLVLASSQGIQRLVSSSSDSTVRRLYEEWLRRLEVYASRTKEEETDQTDSLQAAVVEAERALAQRLPEISRYLPIPTTGPDFPPLSRKEAAVEVIRLPPEKDNVGYLFFLLVRGPQGTCLKLHFLWVSSKWEKQALNAYSIQISPDGAPTTSWPYKMVWQFLDSLLPAQVQRIYFSPDGIYHRINLNTLFDAQRKQYLADRYRILYLTTTRQLLKESPPLRRDPLSSVVLGNPLFYETTSPELVEGVRSVKNRLFPEGIPPLPGAEKEAEQVASILKVPFRTGSDASEAYVKTIENPLILHIATHGYFSGGSGLQAMLQSGLLLSGAGIWDSLYPVNTIEDGFLTAQEASTLRLENTALVTLSACETGLGEITGEGLYGLQRAFIEAGARSVLVSLWKVEDRATHTLMTHFYQAWSKYRFNPEKLLSALGTAQRKLRKQYSHPYFWGAFLLVQ
ncbi:MAG: CHAT domain-containing protein [Bacteroidia bacterium]|nr:CHAT domain-containing protein [Bacteroidia bacterium]